MKKVPILLIVSIISSIFISFSKVDSALVGAWSSIDSTDDEKVVTIVDNYFVFSSFNKVSKKFDHTWGGPVKISGNTLSILVHFASNDKTAVGKTKLLDFKKANKDIVIKDGQNEMKLKWVDDAKKNLSGKWRITARKQEEKITEMPLKPRRTYKILTGTRFQWIAMNIETGEFSGTGGGVYTFANEKYTEQIEFFSRDSSRVGASLQFNGKLVSGVWHHSGLSSKGEPIYEMWSRAEE